jgi:ATP-dependent Clp protease protease subunit
MTMSGPWNMRPWNTPGTVLVLDETVQDRLMTERIIVLGTELTDEVANTICAQLVLLSAADRHRDISLYVNSPGGSVSAGMTVFDTMEYIPNDVATVAIGLAASTAQFLVTAGTPGKRYALPHARILLHQPSGELQGRASDVAVQAEQLLHDKRTLQELTAAHTGHTVEQVARDTERDRWFTAAEPLEYGLVDRVQRTAEGMTPRGFHP